MDKPVIRFTLSEQKLFCAGQTLTDVLSGLNTELGTEELMRSFFEHVFNAQPTVVQEGMLKKVTVTPEQLMYIGGIAPELLPDLGKWFPQPLPHPLQFAEQGMHVAVTMGNGVYKISTVTETQTFNKVPAAFVEGCWYSLDGVHITKAGTASKLHTYIEAVGPVTAAFADEIERQALLVALTGYHQALYSRAGSALYDASLSQVKKVYAMFFSDSDV